MAIEGTTDTLVPNERDYEAVAKQLHVFCVSARGYQQLSGKLEADDSCSGFPELEDTEIPQLKDYASEIVASLRSAAYRDFFIELDRFLTSLMIEVVNGDKPLRLSNKAKTRESKALNKSLVALRQVCGIPDRQFTESLLTVFSQPGPA